MAAAPPVGIAVSESITLSQFEKVPNSPCFHLARYYACNADYILFRGVDTRLHMHQ